MSKVLKVNVHIDVGQDADEEEVDLLTRELRDEIQELEVESVALVKDKTTPEGTKSVEAVTFGALAVAVLPTVVPKLIDLLQNWSTRGEGRKIKIKTQVGDQSLEVEYSPKTMSPEELKGIVDKLTSVVRGEN